MSREGIIVHEYDGDFIFSLDYRRDIGSSPISGDAKNFTFLIERKREDDVVNQTVPILRIEGQVMKFGCKNSSVF